MGICGPGFSCKYPYLNSEYNKFADIYGSKVTEVVYHFTSNSNFT